MGLLDGDGLIASFYTLSGAPVFTPSRHSLAERLAAARDAGFAGIGVALMDCEAQLAGGLSLEELGALPGECGMSVPDIEGIDGWLLEGADARAARESERRMFEFADLFGVRITAVGVFGDMPSLAKVAELYGDLCDRASPHGLIVGLEPLIFGSLQSVADAAEVVTAAARPNGGLVLDAYHLGRASQSMRDALSQVRADQVVAIHLSDAQAQQQGSIFDDCTSHRKLPGEGGLPVVEFLVELDRLGVDAPISVEIFSDELRSVPVEEVARRVLAASESVLATARSLAGPRS